MQFPNNLLERRRAAVPGAVHIRLAPIRVPAFLGHSIPRRGPPRCGRRCGNDRRLHHKAALKPLEVLHTDQENQNMSSQRKPPAPEPSPRMRYYLSNLPTQLRSPEDFDRLSGLMGELPRDILNERMSHKEVRLVRHEFAKLLKAA